MRAYEYKVSWVNTRLPESISSGSLSEDIEQQIREYAEDGWWIIHIDSSDRAVWTVVWERLTGITVEEDTS